MKSAKAQLVASQAEAARASGRVIQVGVFRGYQAILLVHRGHWFQLSLRTSKARHKAYSSVDMMSSSVPCLSQFHAMSFNPCSMA